MASNIIRQLVSNSTKNATPGAPKATGTAATTTDPTDISPFEQVLQKQLLAGKTAPAAQLDESKSDDEEDAGISDDDDGDI